MPKTKSAKFKVMEQSGQSDAERRKLRHELRALNKDLSTNADELEDATSGKFGEARGDCNELFGRVRYAREAVLDSDNLNLIATRAARQIDRLVEVPRYDANRFATKLKQKLSKGSGIDWKKLGNEVGVCFNALPSFVVFLAGPLDAEHIPKERKKVERKQRVVEESDNEEEEEPEDVKQQAKDADQLSAVERNILIVNEVLTKRSKEAAEAFDESEPEAKRRRRCEISAIELLFNPKSFTQTVENLFHFSFAIKHGQASISVEDDGPKTQPLNVKDHPPPRQAIISLNMRDWRRLVEAYGVEQSFIPHRTGSKHSRKSLSQSQS